MRACLSLLNDINLSISTYMKMFSIVRIVEQNTMERKRLGEQRDTERNHGDSQLGKYNIPDHLSLLLRVLNVLLLQLNIFLFECA